VQDTGVISGLNNLRDKNTMNDFKVNQQLIRDCYQLGTLNNSHILLMNNALVPWLVIVPEVNETEFYEIESSQQEVILQQINKISKFIKQEFEVDKLNVATIGNIVKQMHIHIVGRDKNDYCWPGVVWGAEGSKPYTEDEVLKFKEKFQTAIK
jgi:diadenosine tetraphosphate (Ap4A) HIT family hydrolase